MPGPAICRVYTCGDYIWQVQARLAELGVAHTAARTWCHPVGAHGRGSQPSGFPLSSIASLLPSDVIISMVKVHLPRQWRLSVGFPRFTTKVTYEALAIGR